MSRYRVHTRDRSWLTRHTLADDNSALDDLNRVSEAIGGSDNVLDLSAGNEDASIQPQDGSGIGNEGTAEGNAPAVVLGEDSPLGMGFGGKFSHWMNFSDNTRK